MVETNVWQVSIDGVFGQSIIETSRYNLDFLLPLYEGAVVDLETRCLGWKGLEVSATGTTKS